MSNWNFPENKLRTWIPRRPSPDLHTRIFASRETTVPAVAIAWNDLARWLVPALGCFLLVLGSLSPRFHSRAFAGYGGTNAIFPGINSGADEVALSSSGDHSGVNAVPAKRLEWSFGLRSGEHGAGAYLISYTNKLIQ